MSSDDEIGAEESSVNKKYAATECQICGQFKLHQIGRYEYYDTQTVERVVYPNGRQSWLVDADDNEERIIPERRLEDVIYTEVNRVFACEHCGILSLWDSAGFCLEDNHQLTHGFIPSQQPVGGF